MLKKAVIAAALVASFASAVTVSAQEDIAFEHEKDSAAAYASEITELRSTLAGTFVKPGAEITEETFKNVCGAVGRRVKEISEKEGFIIRHASLKSRNPKNAATVEEAELIRKFEASKGLAKIWDAVTIDGKNYFRYSAPVYVNDACLACHGPKEKRPRFIVEKYPQDKAYGYSTGDLRGIISVLIPVK